MKKQSIGRRPMGLRENRWMVGLSRRLNQWRVSPNQVSVAGIGFSAVGATSIVSSHWASDTVAAALLLGAAATLGLRGVCNLLDGLIAIEGGRATPAGPIFNDAPDRISDLLFYVAAGYAIPGSPWSTSLGWAAGSVALLTAYIRLLGGALGTKQHFEGPMGKPHRMGVLAVSLFAASLERVIIGSATSLQYGLIVIIVGGIVTITRRLQRIVAELQ